MTTEELAVERQRVWSRMSDSENPSWRSDAAYITKLTKKLEEGYAAKRRRQAERRR